MKFKLRSSAKHRHGATNVFPHAGETKFDENGFTEVDLNSQEELDHLLKSISDLSLVNDAIVDQLEAEDTITPQVVENTLGKVEDEKNDIGKPAEEELKGIDIMTFDDLKELASDFPAEEWKELDEKELKAYIKTKLGY